MEPYQILLIISLYFVLKLSDKMCSSNASDKRSVFKFSMLRAALGIVIGLFIFLFDGANFNIDLPTVLSATSFGICLSSCMVLTFYTLKHTKVTICSLFASASVIIPTFFGIIVLHNTFSKWKLAGLLLLLISIFFVVYEPSTGKNKFTINAFLLCLGVWLTTGLGAVSVQSFSNYSNNVSSSMFMLLSYIIDTTLLLIALLFIKKSPNEEKKENKRSTWLLWCFLGTVTSFVLQQLQAILSNRVPSVVLFPITTGTGLIMAVLVGGIIFKEKLRFCNVIGIIMGIASLVIINTL